MTARRRALVLPHGALAVTLIACSALSGCQCESGRAFTAVQAAALAAAPTPDEVKAVASSALPVRVAWLGRFDGLEHGAQFDRVRFRFVRAAGLQQVLADVERGEVVELPPSSLQESDEEFSIRVSASEQAERWQETSGDWPLVLWVGNAQRAGGDAWIESGGLTRAYRARSR